MKMHFWLLFVGMIILMGTSCTKKPSASIDTAKTTYTSGEVVILLNKSANATNYEWTMPDGTTSPSASPIYTIPSTQQDGSITFKLKASAGSLYTKSSDATKTINVVTPKGQVVFWRYSLSSTTADISVTMDGTTKNVTKALYMPPGCGDTGFATFTGVSLGIHSFHAYDNSNGTVYDNVVEITENNCTTFFFY